MKNVLKLSDIEPLSTISEVFSHSQQDYIFSHFIFRDKLRSKFDEVVSFDGLSVIMVIKGNLCLSINSEKFTLEPNTLVILRPNDVLTAPGNEDEPADIYTLFLSSRFLKGINFDVNIIRPSRFIDSSPVLHFNRSQKKLLLNYLMLLHNCAISNDSGPNQLGVISRSIGRNLVVSFLYQIAYIREKELTTDSTVLDLPAQRTRKLNYVHDFLKILEQYYRQERNVAFYADKLCISSKYLSMLVREATGHSAATIIDRYVITEAKNMLRYSADTIQQIAYKLNFPNQSAFGKYFKHMTGQSPTTFRIG